jgi:hypothetical protein
MISEKISKEEYYDKELGLLIKNTRRSLRLGL